MPMDRKRYPLNWTEISHYIRFVRGKGRCDWCGVAHGDIHPLTGAVVVLSTAHLGVPKPDGTRGDKHDTLDVRDENLASLCQRCHLNYDRQDHLATQRANRVRRYEQRQPRLIDRSE